MFKKSESKVRVEKKLHSFKLTKEQRKIIKYFKIFKS